MFTTRAPALQPSANSHLVRVADWPRLPAEVRLDRVPMVCQDSKGRFYVAHRGDHPLFCLNPDGTLRNYVGADVHKKSIAFLWYKGKPRANREELYFLHGLHVDPWDNVWVTDIGRHLVMRFDPEGKLTLTLGVDGEAGCDDVHFNQPTAVCVVPSGEIFVTDGYGFDPAALYGRWHINSRVAKFTPDGKFIKDWGQRGTEPGQFHTPHAITVGPDGRLYIADRENDRIQVFSQEGKLLAVWSGLYSVDGLCFAPDGKLYGSVGMANTIIEFDGLGRPVQVWLEPGIMDYPHGIWVDAKGYIYITETGEGPMGDRLLKFQRLPK
jgi:hypothetical protein